MDHLDATVGLAVIPQTGSCAVAPVASLSFATRKLQVIDLFSGVGGLTLGAARAGFEVALAVEKDTHALKAHKLNFPKMRHSDADVSGIDGQTLLAAAGLSAGKLDGLIGGPPCQGFSSMGPRLATDPRNDLFRKFFELVDQTKPQFFVAENVKGILESKYAEIRNGALDLVRSEYELLPAMKLKAYEFGAPTVRERVFFVGYRKGSSFALTSKEFDDRKVTTQIKVKQALQGLPVEISDTWQTEEQGWRFVTRPEVEDDYWKNIIGNIPPGVGHEKALLRYKDENSVSGCLGTVHEKRVGKRYGALRSGKKDPVSKSLRLDNEGFCPTLRAGTAADKGSHQAVRPIHPTVARVITPREAARLQGFPDWFQFAPSKWHSFRQIGNSVSPFVAEAVLSAIHSKLSTQQTVKSTI